MRDKHVHVIGNIVFDKHTFSNLQLHISLGKLILFNSFRPETHLGSMCKQRRPSSDAAKRKTRRLIGVDTVCLQEFLRKIQ